MSITLADSSRYSTTMRQLFTLSLLACTFLCAQYTRVLQLSLDTSKPHQGATVSLGAKDAAPALTLAFGDKFAVKDAKGQPLIEIALSLKDSKGNLQLWFAADHTQAVLDGQVVASGKAAGNIPQRPAITSSYPEFSEKAKPLFQRLSSLNFQDDFARAEENGEALWKPLSGHFAPNASLNPGSALGAFQLWGSTTTDGIPAGASGRIPEAIAVSTTSRWFWRDIRFGVSAILPTESQIWGLVFAYNSPDDFLRVEFDRAAGEARLVRRTGGTDTVLQRGKIVMTTSWTRAEIIAAKGEISVYYAAQKLFSHKENRSFAGQVGLFLRNAPTAFFDDVSVTSCTACPAQLDSPFGPCERNWSDFSDKQFFTDAYMSHWAHPRSFWNDGPDKLLWFRSRLFNDISFTWKAKGKIKPLPSLRLRAFTDEAKPESGFLLTVAEGKATLLLDGAKIAEAPAPATISKLSVNATADFTAVFNDKEKISWKAPAAVARKGFIATSLGPASGVERLHAPDWRDTALVSSSHRMDYSFEHAPTVWYPQAGDWKATHRWACVPKWSFFAGRGTPSPAEVDNGNAVLWNLRKITGDFDLEIFAAPLEGTPQRAHFTYPLNLNLSFGADGSNLNSGYTFINGIYDEPSKLFLNNKLLASNSDRVVPTLRLQENAWYNRVTRVWQHFRIQRRNGRILVDSASNGDHAEYLPLKRVFDQPDSLDAAKPSQFAVWAWGGNGLAIARATLSFQSSPGGALPPADVQKPQTLKGDGKSEPASYTRVFNPISGGQFVTVLHDKPFELSKTNRAELLVRPGKDTHLSLIATINGQAFETVISGPQTTRPYTYPVGVVSSCVKEMPGWLRLDITLDEVYLQDCFRPNEPLVCTSIAIASPYDNIEEIAGLGINPRGAMVDYTQPKLSFAEIVYKLAPSNDLRVHAHGRRLLIDFEDDMGEFQRFGGHDGAALLRVPREMSGDASSGLEQRKLSSALRMLNQNIGGTAGATITSTPFLLTAFPKIAFDYAIPKGCEINLIAVTDNGCFEIKLTGADQTWPIVGDAKITQDGQWHHTEIDLEAMLKPRLKEPFVIRKLILADSNRMSTYQRIAMYVDNLQFIPRLANGDKFTIAETSLADKSVAICFDKSPNTIPDAKTAVASREFTVAIPQDGAIWLHIARTVNGDIRTPVTHLRIETAAAPVKNDVPTPQKAAVALQPPLISYIPSDRLVRDTFELPARASESAEVMGGFEIRRQAWAIRNTETAATGSACGELVNLNPHDFCSIFFRKAAWDVNRWPCFSFNYRFRQPNCALVLSLLVNDAMTIVEWTGKDRHGSYFTDGLVGKTDEYAIQDGQWHESVCDLRAHLLKTRFAKTVPPTGITATELSTWATNHHGGGYANPADARVYIDNFTIYSNRGKDPAFEWQRRATDAGYAVVFDQTAETVPAEKVTQTENRAEFKNVAPGTWFLHVRTQDKSGAWSAPAHKKIIIEK